VQGLIAILFLAASLVLFAGEEERDPLSFSGTLTLGGGYESDVARSQGTLGARQGAGDLLTEVSGEVTVFEEFSLGASLLYDLMPAHGGRYTRTLFGATADWYRDLGPVELDLGAAGDFTLVDRFDPEPYFGSFEGYAELVVPQGEALEWLIALTGAYQHGLRDDVSYLRGPDLFLQGSVRWHFDEERGLVAGGYRAGVSLRKKAGLYDVPGLPEAGYIALEACHEHFEQALFGKGAYDLSPVSLSMRLSVIHRYAFEKDVWTTLAERKEKRRIELVLAPSVEARWMPVEAFEVAFQYDLEYTVSSLGKSDYYDFNGPRHTVKVLMTRRF